ncbi:MAG: NAD(P)/FAD-dependent oxidoreductase [Planctomycetota bacterium]
MHYDVVIIGAGMSGLAAGIRLAYFDKRVCIVEKHYAFGGLNSYYRLGGRDFDVGLHAVTNFASPEHRNAPLNRLFRQLRLSRDDFDLCPQRYSEVRFPGRRLRFTNDVKVLVDEVTREFPPDADNFRRLLSEVERYDGARLDAPYRPTRSVLGEFLREPTLIEMLLCPIMLYGSAEEHDMDFTQFVTLFKSLFCEGFARPRGGVRTIISALVKKYRSCGGKLRMSCGVRRLEIENGRVVSVTLESGETLTADVVFSSAGYVETMRLCPDGVAPPKAEEGRISFVETVSILDAAPASLGHDATIVFFNDAETFTYAVPRQPVDLSSGILCCPNNYERHEDMVEGVVRLTWLANYERWASLDETAYVASKRAYQESMVERVREFLPAFSDHVVFTDIFTPRTIRQYTGHLNGAVYGSPRKRRDGRTPYENLYICGTDQGYLGIIGAMLSGITMANLHVLAKEGTGEKRS